MKPCVSWRTQWTPSILTFAWSLSPGSGYGQGVPGPLDHPRADRFDAATFEAGLSEAGLQRQESRQLAGAIGWFTAARATGPAKS